jgi:hypothetical protein
MKTVFILISIFLTSIIVSAQTIYIKAYGGYGLGTNKSELSMLSSYYNENTDTNFTTYGYESAKFSLGKSLRFGFATGVSLTKNISFELAADYSKGKSPKFIECNNGTYEYGTIYTVKFTDKYNYEGNSVQLTPALVYKANQRKITPYLKLGLIIGITKLSKNFERRLYNTIPTYYPFESWASVLKYKTSISGGLTVAIGGEYMLADDIYFFSEAKYSILNCSPKTSELTEYRYRGMDELETLPYNERNFEYVNAYTDSDNIDRSAPGKRLIQKYALSNVAIVVGFKIDFNLKKQKK